MCGPVLQDDDGDDDGSGGDDDVVDGSKYVRRHVSDDAVAPPPLLSSLCGHGSEHMISCVRLLHDGGGEAEGTATHALSASGDRTLKLWDLEQGACVLSLVVGCRLAHCFAQ